MEQEMNVCADCSKTNASKLCGGCKKVYYCDEECQSSHWKKHKKQCKWKNLQNMQKNKKTANKTIVIKKIKNIYVPRPGDDSDDIDYEETPSPIPIWHRHFEPDELLGRYEPIRDLGRGYYGVVYHGKVLKQCETLESEKQIAIKKIRRVFHTENDTKRILKELRILYALRNDRYIMKLYDIIPPKQPKRFSALTIILEFVDADLGKIFGTNQFFTRLHVKYILYQILLGVECIHSMNIAHRDLKPSNIFINENCCIKIGDFDKAYIFEENDDELMIIKKQREERELLELQRKEEKKKEEKNAKNGSNKTKNDNKRKKKRMKLLKKKKPRRNRGICRYVVCRWYRSPEEILLEQKASKLVASDMWSIGAIFAELLQMQRENRPDPIRRGPIFPGNTCFPLPIGDEMDFGPREDQMQFMLDMIGSPDESEINKIRNEKARKYLRGLPQRKRKNLKRYFPGTDKDTLDLLRLMITFDVDKRITIKQALQHKYFETLSNIELKCHEKREKYAYDINGGYEIMKMKQKELRSLILEQVLKFNGFEQQRFIESGAMVTYKLDVVLNGYVRIYIEPLFDRNVIIPMSLIQVCYVFLKY